MAEISPDVLESLLSAAQAAAGNAYAPYSHFSVGSAILTEDGRIFAGCNVENASYGLTMCAERNAIGSAIALGHRKIRCVVVYTPTENPTLPCGACRQVIQEFGPEARIVCIGNGHQKVDTHLGQLLPGAFDRNALSL